MFTIKRLSISITALLLALMSSVAFAQTSSITLENRVKAAYLYNILKFTQWQKFRPAEDSSPIHICVLGRDSIADALEPITKKIVQGRPITLEIISTFDAQKRCQVLLINAKKRHKNLFKVAENAGVLTLSSHEYFAVDGGMIGFVIRNGKVHMEVNVVALRQAGIQMSSKLLEISTLIKSDADQKK